MFYELRINCYCKNQSDFDDVRDKLRDLEPQMKVIKPGHPDQQCSVIELIENHHDDTPNGPCILIDHWDNCPTPP